MRHYSRPNKLPSIRIYFASYPPINVTCRCRKGCLYLKSCRDAVLIVWRSSLYYPCFAFPYQSGSVVKMTERVISSPTVPPTSPQYVFNPIHPRKKANSPGSGEPTLPKNEEAEPHPTDKRAQDSDRKEKRKPPVHKN